MPIDRNDPIYLLRQQLAAAITRALGGSDSQHVIAPYYGIQQPRMSELSRGIVDRCTLEWLIRRLHRLGGTVTLQVEVGDARRAWYQMMFKRQRERMRKGK